MTNYYKDNYEVYYSSSSKLKWLVNYARKHITIDAGGLITGVIGLILIM